MIKIAKPLSAYKGKQRAGKWFEKQVVEPAINKLEKEQKGFQHRFVDTNEARNVVRGQPSDYLIAMSGQAFLLEAKASEAKDKFIPSLLEAAQVNGIYRWGRAGHASYIVFCSCKAGRVDIYDGRRVVQAKLDGKRLTDELLVSGRVDELDEMLLGLMRP